jgi:hypothetical protein
VGKVDPSPTAPASPPRPPRQRCALVGFFR